MTFAMSYFAMNVTNPGISDIHNEEVKTFVHTYIQVEFPRKKRTWISQWIINTTSHHYPY